MGFVSQWVRSLFSETHFLLSFDMTPMRLFWVINNIALKFVNNLKNESGTCSINRIEKIRINQ